MRVTNRFKAAFVSLYLTVAGVFAVVAMWHLSNGSDVARVHYGWLGAALANGPIVLTLGWWMLARRQPRTSAGLTPIMALAVSGLGLAAVGYQLGQPNSLEPLIYTGVGLAGFLIYVKWYSVFTDRDSAVLEVGRPMPEIPLENADGTGASSRDFMGKTVLYMFYRGNWCPLCMAQIKEIAASYRELSERGVEIVLISPQPHTHTAKLAKRFDVPFHFLVDPGSKAAEILGIAALGGIPLGMELFGYDQDTVMPTVVIVNTEGEILFADQTDNYRVRPEPETFFHVLDAQHTD
ncbi:MAG: redoxin domain-containing protein [Alphaproteobacteria bacterium]|jgi:peroxiredoxin|nr:redoxin domain-containing protein [Alphaproteobacteria bacterium]MBT4020016.1 redoxin domain-containing protein [Alphaproteobacteria bacterium]MBT5161298.1 redoxin domain-containing protein [Alphaproteobacteria bacterium]MBT5917351.1 redoxin domain-containing protein [Alphaproteobacteria bacterium]MBT6387556.1 redoxin domain-containing protein [Alphaproteobacteria bacterium]